MTQIKTTDIDVQLISHSGNDNSIVAAARVSTQGEDSIQDLEGDVREGLIRYLMANRHGTPFEHASMTFYIKAPIFVFREFHRHRVGWSYNEESGRYKQLEPEFYTPNINRPGLKQKPGGRPGHYEYEEGEVRDVMMVGTKLLHSYQVAYDHYQDMLDQGIAKEVARMCLPVGIFSSMYATCNPRSLLHFLSLRTNVPDATFPSKPQYEINVVASEMENIFAELFPVTYAAYLMNGRVAP